MTKMSNNTKWNKLLILYTFLLISLSSTVHASDWADIAEEITMLVNETVQLYKAGETKQAKRKIIKAYFGVFESKKFEAAMRQEMGGKYAFEVEQKFGKMRKLIKKQHPIADIEQLAQDIISTIRKDALTLDKKEIPLHVFDPSK